VERASKTLTYCHPDFLSTHHTIALKLNEEKIKYQKQKETQEGKLQRKK
jgi:hypothetical protein